MNLVEWEKRFLEFYTSYHFEDASHDIYHFKRVWKTARLILENESADELVILAGCYFHDIVSFEKNDPRRSESSKIAAIKTGEILNELNFPNDKIEAVKHCVEAHSFSAGIEPKTIEAKVVQDADRMEALGAIGVARCFYTAGRMKSELFHPEDSLGESRELDDKKYALDHFSIKLLKLPKTMQTESGKKLADERAEILVQFKKQLNSEL
jgi:uncharacterized protein